MIVNPYVYAASVAPDPAATLLLQGKGAAGARDLFDTSGNFRDMQPSTNCLLSTTQTKFGAPSIAFNGTDSRADIVSATNEFGAFLGGIGTIDLWFYATSTSGVRFIWQINGTDGSHRLSLIITGGVLNLNGADGSTGGGAHATLVGTTTIPLNTWMHVAVERNGTSMKMFLNGALEASGTDLLGCTSQLGFTLGTQAFSPGAGDFFAGYMAQVRMLNGTAAYGGVAFTPRTAAYTPGTTITGAQTIFQLNSTGSNGSTAFADSSTVHPATVTNTNGATIQGNKAQFVAASAQSLRILNSAFNFGAKDFEYDFAFQTSSTTQSAALVSYENTAGSLGPGVISIVINTASATDGVVGVYFGDYSTSAVALTSSGGLNNNVRHTGIFKRVGSTLSLTIDGTLQSSVTFTGRLTNLYNPLVLGNAYIATGRALSGLVDAVSLTVNYP